MRNRMIVCDTDYKDSSDWFVSFLVTLTAAIILIFLLRSTFDEQDFANKYRPLAQQAIESCEKYLPRSQKCKVVISAEIVE